MNDFDKKRRAKNTKKSDEERVSEYVKEVEKMFPSSVGGGSLQDAG